MGLQKKYYAKYSILPLPQSLNMQILTTKCLSSLISVNENLQVVFTDAIPSLPNYLWCDCKTNQPSRSATGLVLSAYSYLLKPTGNTQKGVLGMVSGFVSFHSFQYNPLRVFIVCSLLLRMNTWPHL